MNSKTPRRMSPVDHLIRFCLENRLITIVVTMMVIGAGILVAPFEWRLPGIERAPVAVDAIPDIGENQQIVYTEWPGRSPQDIEDQVTYPLTVALLGIPNVKSVRSVSMFGFSTVYVIFDEGAEFYWTRSRVLEKLSSLPAGTLPESVRPQLGPDATALGQVYWYTLEGRDGRGEPTGGWDPQELHSIQDFFVRYALASADGVAEVASVGGFVKEYQIDVDPDAMRAHGVTLQQVYDAVRRTNIDAGARTVEVNRVEYMVRGIGFVKSINDLEQTVVQATDNVPVRITDVANVGLGPALRSGVLDKEGTEAVGGVVVARFGENPLEVITNVKDKIRRIAPGLPSKRLADGRRSRVTIVPFYDRTALIRETLGTLGNAIRLEILITVLVILVMVNHAGSSVLISIVLPLSVLMSFIGMKLLGVPANIASLSGIAIAIGTIVDMGIVLTENTLKHLTRARPDEPVKEVVYRAASEVGGAITTSVATTIVGFLPVFTMVAAEGKLFKPLAYTKTFALAASIIVALALIPTLMAIVFRRRKPLPHRWSVVVPTLAVLTGLALAFVVEWWLGLLFIVGGARYLGRRFLPSRWARRLPLVVNAALVAIVGLLLAFEWLPLGAQHPTLANVAFVALAMGGLLGGFKLFTYRYASMLNWFLSHRAAFLGPFVAIILLGATVWLGFGRVFFFLPRFVRSLPPVVALNHSFPGLGKEFMPRLDEGSFLFMPTTMAHASLGAAAKMLRTQDMAIRAVPEVEIVVGKLGRAESALDPAPTSMFETVITLKPEYVVDEKGRRIRFAYDRETDAFQRDSSGALIPDKRGRPYRNWRDHIRSTDDIWDEITAAAKVVGVTGAPKLQPIEARVVMLQSGMRAPMGIKIKGPDLATIERTGLYLERLLKQVPSVDPASVIADRVVGKPYLEIHIDRDAIARYGLTVQAVQDVIEFAAGGKPITTTVEGRERYNVRVRYPRELRGTPETLMRILVPTMNGAQVPLGQLARIEYRRGPEMFKGEETFLTSYVLFKKRDGHAEVNVVEDAQALLADRAASGDLSIPPGVTYEFAGSYRNQLRAQRTLSVVLPFALLLIFLILYLQFRRVQTTAFVFSGILLTWAGGFILIWLYGQSWFLDFAVFGVNLRELFQIRPINLSVAVWVGFLALFGIATDDAVLMCTYLDQQFSRSAPRSIQEIRRLTIQAAVRRVRPALMTSATTILALLAILTSTGRGAEVMIPMAIPSFGGMILELATIFQAPILYSLVQERKLRRRGERDA